MPSVSVAQASEPSMPTDLRKALATHPAIQTLWMSLTPIARRDWISWIHSAEQAESKI